MIYKSIVCIFIILSLSSSKLFAGSNDTLFVAFWNLENLFDTIDDPNKTDEDFLPESELQWTHDKLDKKMYNLSRVIRSMNNGKGPDILGVCEIENQALLDGMIAKYLSDLSYKTAYIESPDNRGIDNGLIYKTDNIKLLNVQADTITLADKWPTRLIFGANLLLNTDEKITVFVNHWPSRRGGEKDSEPNRIEAALTLRSAVDRIFSVDPESKIFIIGDFNDEPLNTSLLDNLKANPFKCDSMKMEYEVDSAAELYNLSYDLYEDGFGSYKYKDDWNMLDQIIVSSTLIVGKEMQFICNSFAVYKPDFIVTHSGKYKGTPFPTFGGKLYLGGYSDHFPVTAKFIFNRSSD